MTIKLTFAQRRALDVLLAQGERGIPRMQGFKTPTEEALIKAGYATWLNGESGTATLTITEKGRSFYPSHHHRS